MFTGIIQSLGTVVDSLATSEGLRLRIDIGKLDPASLNLGDSVAVNGVCLTVTSLQDKIAIFDVSRETLDKCLIGEWKQHDIVNIEPALTLNTPLGGHLVSGHVDATATLVDQLELEKYTRMTFQVERSFGRFVAIKGSIAVNGISLTTNTVTDKDDTTEFEVMLVPHTLTNTTLGRLSADSQVHIEVDLIARYLNRLMEVSVEKNG